MRLGKAFVVAALLASGAANAASLEDAAGDVRVSRGKGFAAGIQCAAVCGEFTL